MVSGIMWGYLDVLLLYICFFLINLRLTTYLNKNNRVQKNYQSK